MDTLVLDQIILDADSDKCEIFFEKMSEHQRKLFAPRAVELIKDLNLRVWEIRSRNAGSVKYTGIESLFDESTELSLLKAKVAVLSTCTLAELKKLGEHALPDPEEAARIMLARKPTWLATWCDFVLRAAPNTHWVTLYRLEQTGVKIERTSNYWLGLHNSLLISPRVIEELIRKDPILRSEIWDMLDDSNVTRKLSEPVLVAYEAYAVSSMRAFRRTHSESTLSSIDGPNVGKLEIFESHLFGPNEQNSARQSSDLWRNLLVQLATESLIDREKLIEYSFAALLIAGEKAFKNRSAFFAIHLNEALTEDCVKNYSNSYVSLIGAIHKDVAIYALNTLLKMHTKFLNCSDICHNITLTFLNKDKVAAETALTLLERLVMHYPEMRNVYGPAILSALGHSTKNIQRHALDLLDRSKTLEDATLRKNFLLRTEMLTGLEKTKAVKLFSKFEDAMDSPKDNSKIATKLGAAAVFKEFSNVSQKSESVAITNKENSVVTASDTTRASSSKRLDLLNERAIKLNPALLSIVRFEEAVQLYESGDVLDAPVIFDSSKFPSLTKHIAVKPISDLDNLIYTLLKVASGTSDAMELETALDGISRMCVFPSDSKEKAQALWEKAQQTYEDVLYHDKESFHRLMAAWIHRIDVDIKKYFYESCSFFSHRCHAVQRRVIAKQPAGLLALPTHSGGWIDPEILVQRIIEYSQMESIPDQVDVIQALLRIATEGRSSALRAAGALKGEVGAAVRYALGGEQEEIITPAYWIAAFRAREP